MKNGVLVISLDFEMYWGLADSTDLEVWIEPMKNVRIVVERLIEAFKKYEIHATWATVGALMAKNEEEFFQYLPDTLPEKTVGILRKIGLCDSQSAKCPVSILFAGDLVSKISKTDGMEIATHTYTHYCCGEKSSNTFDFSNELNSSIQIAKNKGYDLKTIVFPKIQVLDEYINILNQNKINIFRGNENSWVFRLKEKNVWLGKLFWYLDHYLPLTNLNYELNSLSVDGVFNCKKSRFFKPYKNKYKLIEPLKVLRYKFEMYSAAKKGKIYHICWHPHNFAVNINENMKQLESLLVFYKKMEKKFGMKSMNMEELSLC